MKINKKCILAVASFVLLLLQAFGLKIDLPVVNELIAAGASVLVMLGIVSDSGTSSDKTLPSDKQAEDEQTGEEPTKEEQTEEETPSSEEPKDD